MTFIELLIVFGAGVGMGLLITGLTLLFHTNKQYKDIPKEDD